MSLADRSIRIMVGITLFLIGPLTNLVETDTISNILLSIVGTIALISGASAYCFLYDITGLNTLREK
ncbi:MAG: DUF2892 domain-containing protein [Anaerolineales bacterium]